MVVVGCGSMEDGQSERGGGWLWVCGRGAVGLGLWRWGYRFVEVVCVGLWVCEGWPVRMWQCLVVGLFRWSCVFGIVEVGLWFASDEKEEKSLERREEETEK